MRGILGTLGGVGMQDDIEALWTPGMRTYQDRLVPGGYDPAARIEVLDDEGIDKALLYPTHRNSLGRPCHRREARRPYVRAYNRYIVDFCSL